MIGCFNAFVKITGYIPQKLVFRTKVYYEDKAMQSRKIKGGAIIVSNHTSVYDYAVMLFLFPFRTLRYQMAEVLFEKKGLGAFLKAMGGIRVDRNSADSSFLKRSESILAKGGVVGVFPESRLPKEGEERPLKFVSSTAYLGLKSGVPIIPVYTSGEYFGKKRAKVIIGRPVCLPDMYDKTLSEKENVEKMTDYLRERIIDLGKQLDEKIKSSVN